MKKAILTFGMMFLAVMAFDVNAQATAAPVAKAIQVGGAEISFEKEVHDYGVMEQNGNGQCEFVFTNTFTPFPLGLTNAAIVVSICIAFSFKRTGSSTSS